MSSTIYRSESASTPELQFQRLRGGTIPRLPVRSTQTGWLTRASKAAVLVGLVAVLGLAVIPRAHADDDDFGAGILGFALGAIAAAPLTSYNTPYYTPYYAPPPVVYYTPPPVIYETPPAIYYQPLPGIYDAPPPRGYHEYRDNDDYGGGRYRSSMPAGREGRRPDGHYHGHRQDHDHYRDVWRNRGNDQR